MHSENLRIDAESFLDVQCIDLFSQRYLLYYYCIDPNIRQPPLFPDVLFENQF